MFPNAKGSELLAVLATIDPSNQPAGAATSGWLSVSNYHGLLALIEIGSLANGSTVDAKLQQATDGSGSGAKDIADKAITQLTQAAGGANRQALVNLRPDEMDVNNGYTFVRLVLTVGTAAAFTSAQVLGVNPRYEPADGSNQTAVAQVV